MPGKKFPDLTGDGKVTQADILKGRGVNGMMRGGQAKKKMMRGGKVGMMRGGSVKPRYKYGGCVMKKTNQNPTMV